MFDKTSSHGNISIKNTNLYAMSIQGINDHVSAQLPVASSNSCSFMTPKKKKTGITKMAANNCRNIKNDFKLLDLIIYQMLSSYYGKMVS